MNDRASYKRLWGLFAFVVLASFAVLGGFGFRIASEAPPRNGPSRRRVRYGRPPAVSPLPAPPRGAGFSQGGGPYPAGRALAALPSPVDNTRMTRGQRSQSSACLFATFGLGNRYSMWLQRPPGRNPC